MKWVGSGTVTELITNDDTLKSHCQITGTGTTYDLIMAVYIKAAGAIIEQLVGYPIRYPNATVYFDTTTTRAMRLPKNINAITTYYYKDGDEYLEQTFTNIIRNDYKDYSELWSTEIKQNTSYKIVCTANLTTSDVVKQACRMLVAEMFESRENKQLKTTGGATNYGQWLDIFLSGEIAHNL